METEYSNRRPVTVSVSKSGVFLDAAEAVPTGRQTDRPTDSGGHSEGSDEPGIL